MSSPNVEKIQDAPVPTDEEFNLVAETATGEIIRLPEHRGNVIFINLWATWCGPCIAEMNSLERLYNLYKDKVTFVFLSLEDPGVIKSFASRREMTIPLSWPVAYLPEMFHSNSYPTTFIINKKGSIVVKETGASDWDSENVHELLDELIEE
jgi:thiol-disulfide isomerase/thioredoxin